MLLLKDLLEPWKKNYKYMTSVWKNVYIDKLDDKDNINKFVNKYNITYHSTT